MDLRVINTANINSGQNDHYHSPHGDPVNLAQNCLGTNVNPGTNCKSYLNLLIDPQFYWSLCPTNPHCLIIAKEAGVTSWSQF